MTEGQTLLNYKPMCIRIWLQVGHACEPRPQSSFGRSLALDWRIWVRGRNDCDISQFVHKVVFHLNPPSAFVYPKRVLQEPPYEIQESGSSSIDIPIYVYLKHSIKPKKIKLRYSIHIDNLGESSNDTSCVFYDIQNPPEVLEQLLMKGGGEMVSRTSQSVNNKLIVIDKDLKIHRVRKRNESKVKKNKMCPEDSKAIDFTKILKAVKMSRSEIDLVSKLYMSYSSYEKSADALVLPPLADPIYKVPELPVSLRGCLSSVERDYAMQ